MLFHVTSIFSVVNLLKLHLHLRFTFVNIGIDISKIFKGEDIFIKASEPLKQVRNVKIGIDCTEHDPD